MTCNQGLCFLVRLSVASVWVLASITVVVAFVQSNLPKCPSNCRTPLRSKNAAGVHLHLHDRAGGNDDVIPNLSELRQYSYHKLLKFIPPSVQIVLIGEGGHTWNWRIFPYPIWGNSMLDWTLWIWCHFVWRRCAAKLMWEMGTSCCTTALSLFSSRCRYPE